MKKALVLSPRAQDARIISNTLGDGLKVKWVKDPEVCRMLIAKQGCDFLFLDISHCDGARWVVDFKAVFRPYWHASRGLEIILLCDREMVRSAVYSVVAASPFTEARTRQSRGVRLSVTTPV